MIGLTVLNTEAIPMMPARNKRAAKKYKGGNAFSFHLNQFTMMKQLPEQFNSLWKKLEMSVEEER